MSNIFIGIIIGATATIMAEMAAIIAASYTAYKRGEEHDSRRDG